MTLGQLRLYSEAIEGVMVLHNSMATPKKKQDVNADLRSVGLAK
jgi:hypothetical protein